jgi:crotonobetainyl-CoA:carnitine CoA-transferase CaiB-like acyl-CoA transferase
VAPVLDIAEVATDPQVAARGAIVEARPPGGAAPFRQLAPLLAGAPRRDVYDLPDPSVTDTEALLAAAGMSADEIEALLAEGVIS